MLMIFCVKQGSTLKTSIFQKLLAEVLNKNEDLLLIIFLYVFIRLWLVFFTILNTQISYLCFYMFSGIDLKEDIQKYLSLLIVEDSIKNDGSMYIFQQRSRAVKVVLGQGFYLFYQGQKNMYMDMAVNVMNFLQFLAYIYMRQFMGGQLKYCNTKNKLM
eukprot:TRINITY_DN6001_c0_g1_i7.p3 TRINITY_DN6001_c0_g1~~TRINITY_DN6001_c0_g1_i7.p3  ORF type:complete len:159 (+),score=10.48 TRINITY_DN6001_c0_g1_i7:297-773(+)